ncbi:DNA-binding response regulator [Salipiger pallidus]|uniref:DNA-binding response regulator n=1 Tax=Salipiger pallidus TaxID=1775170 RepID=A0A8J2ZM83_9RHOB|nr:response regulator transcription factor [Salipiger pallidus]GGG80591.1 DNA-binding response regulator [Salipiger pallidus]
MRYLIAETSWKLVSLSKAIADTGTLVTRCEGTEDVEDYHKIGAHDGLIVDAAFIGRSTSLSRLRDLAPNKPICVLARKATPQQIAKWLMSGADTVIDEAAPLPEIIARIGAVARRTYHVPQPVLHCGPLRLDLEARRVHLGDVTLSLSPKLYEIIEFLALRAGALASREELLNHVYGFENEPAPRVFDVYMCNLRNHLSPVSDVLGIETVRGSGYRLEVSEGRVAARSGKGAMAAYRAA